MASYEEFTIYRNGSGKTKVASSVIEQIVTLISRDMSEISEGVCSTAKNCSTFISMTSHNIIHKPNLFRSELIERHLNEKWVQHVDSAALVRGFSFLCLLFLYGIKTILRMERNIMESIYCISRHKKNMVILSLSRCKMNLKVIRGQWQFQIKMCTVYKLILLQGGIMAKRLPVAK